MRQNIENSRISNARHESTRFASLKRSSALAYTMTQNSPTVHEIDPLGASVNVTLPNYSLEQFYSISNIGASGSLEILDHLGASLASVPVSAMFLGFATGVRWVFLVGSSSIANSPAAVTAAITGAIAASTTFVWTNQAGNITLTLPNSVTWETANSALGIPLSVFDMSGAAQTNTVTIDTTGGQTINGMASVVIDSDFGGYRFRPKPGGGWVMV
jgi:hypothetical protein